jgi:hypothetical protein
MLPSRRQDGFFRSHTLRSSTSPPEVVPRILWQREIPFQDLTGFGEEIFRFPQAEYAKRTIRSI